MLGLASGERAESKRGVAWQGISKGLLLAGLEAGLGEKPLLYGHGGGEGAAWCHHSV